MSAPTTTAASSAMAPFWWCVRLSRLARYAVELWCVVAGLFRDAEARAEISGTRWEDLR